MVVLLVSLFSCITEPSEPKSSALVPAKEYPLVPYKQDIFFNAPQQVKSKSLTDFLIKTARGIRLVAFVSRATFVGVTSAIAIYNATEAKDAPDIVKSFCYKEAGRNDFSIKTREDSAENFAAGFNTLYVPTGYGSGLQQALELKKSLELRLNERCSQESLHCKKVVEKQLKKNKKEIDLFKGIIDHEMAHLNNRDSYRKPLFLMGSLITMEAFWSKARPALEDHFKKVSYPNNTLKGALYTGARWTTRLVLPTALYTTTFFAVRQLIRKTIEAQADAAVRDDEDVLKAQKKAFSESAEWDKKHLPVSKLSSFFSTHPSDESRANYFAQRLKELEQKKKNH